MTATRAAIPGIDPTAVTPVPLVGADGVGSEWLPVHAPYDGSLLGSVPSLTPADVDRAVAAARRALDGGPLPQWRRAEILDRAAEKLADRVEQFARCIALEAAKPIRTARIEVERAVSTLRFSAATARQLTGDMVPLDASAAGEGRIGFVLRVPVGVVAAIAPFNFPLNLVAHKLGPAIAAGCPVVLKPASQTPFSSILLARMLLEECGLAAGYLQVVTGPGSVIGNALVDHDDIALVTFTGSPEVGWGIRARAPRKRVGLELGNNAPVILEPDGDWRAAVGKIRLAGFSHAGQSCISTQRVLVHADIADEVEAALDAAVRSLVVGDPLDEDTEVSALISTGERDRVLSWVHDAEAQGARVLAGGTVRPDGVLEPTLIADADPQLTLCTQEVFGPVVAITRYDSFDEALRLANDTRYGLQAGVFTADIHKALAAARTLDFGGVIVNDVPTWRADQQPYGGVRDSGNTREGPAWSVREMTEERLIVLAGP
ncbi:MAG TPA: aldehyde dehydrogenase family protein [Jatrophihabitans sp.]|uniref:aldehyde dehydrogenase family protein n=1 Tax=Jatrophihabitans sp. TaxID=1932789 RepID=UPI002DFBCDA8|nr:aldehyde dehydrogenase family protein [Jatrophihabitans sp.]